MVTEKIDALDMVISVLLEHEKTLNGLISRFEYTLDEPNPGGLTYIQVIGIIDSYVYAIKEVWEPETENTQISLKEVMLRDFVHALNRRNMISTDWVETLLQYGIGRQNE